MTAPNTNLDVANKWYVDQQISNISAGNIYITNVTTNSIFTTNISSVNLISDNGTIGILSISGSTHSLNSTTGTIILFNGGLSINDTYNSTSATSGGALTIAGGAGINGDLYIGGKIDVNENLITNVTAPNTNLDVANKWYVDQQILNAICDCNESTLILNNNVIIPEDILDFKFNSTLVTSFEANIYLKIPELNVYDMFKIYGVRKQFIWVINSQFYGDYPNGITFSIVNSGGFGQIQYTNTNAIGTAELTFKSDTIGDCGCSIGNIINTSSGNFYTNGCLLFGNGGIVLTDLNLRYLDNMLVLNTNIPALNPTTGTLVVNGGVSINDNLLVKEINITSTVDATNASSGGALTIAGGAGIKGDLYIGKELYVKNVEMTPNLYDIFTEQIFYANNNQNIATNVSGFNFTNDTRYFTAWCSVSIIANTNKVSGFTIEGIQLNTSGNWLINSKYIGENTGIIFNINNGQIQYTSTNQVGFVSNTMKFRGITTSI